MKISSHKCLNDSDTRLVCPGCKKSRRYYCYSCLTLCGIDSNDVPNVDLPIECHMIKHLEESDSKSTAVHAHLLSKQVTLFSYPGGHIPPYTSTGDVVVCFPYKHSLSIEQYCQDIKLGSRKFPKIVLFLDGTWSNVQQIAQIYQNYPSVKLTKQNTAFWRRHLRHIPNSYLSTIEAVYFFYKEFHQNIPIAPNPHHFDNLLFFFSFQHKLSRNSKMLASTSESSLFIPEVEKYLLETFSEDSQLDNLLPLISLPPAWTTIRVHTLNYSRNDVISELRNLLDDKFQIIEHPVISDVVVLSGENTSDLAIHQKVIIDMKCGKSVLRGADVFAPGVKGLPHLKTNTHVSVHVDIDHKCKRGEKDFQGKTLHVANGILMLNRFDIFKNMTKSGIAVRITNKKVNIPCLNGVLQEKIFLQNLPSTVTVHVLDPMPGEVILDMCAAPGGKTTHIGQLMKDSGTVIALEKVKQKVEKLKQNISQQGLTCVNCFQFDATKCYSETADEILVPPFGKETFDRILVDPPCSALGQRPQLKNHLKLSEITTYSSYQWSFIADAVKMLKYGGTLVFSTCTFPVQENEMIVARTLTSFPEMRLVSAEPLIGKQGIGVPGLSEADLQKVQRFTPVCGDVDTDTIGFFIAKFQKLALEPGPD